RIAPAIYPESVPLAGSIWVAPGEPVPVAEGLAASREPVAVGDRWGAPWGTSWLTVSGTVPAAWAGKTVEAIIDLGFDKNMPGFQCEGLVYRPDGSPVKGLNPRNQWVRVADRAEGGGGAAARRGGLEPGDPGLPPLPADAARRQGDRRRRAAVQAGGAGARGLRRDG